MSMNTGTMWQAAFNNARNSARSGLVRGRDRYTGENGGWARAVSDVLNPPLVWALVALPVAAREVGSVGAAFGWAAIYWTLVCIAPVIYIVVQVRRGAITDIHMQVREQRLKPFLVSAAGAMAACIVLAGLQAPTLLTLFALFTLVQIVIMLLITLRWQISMHTMSIAGAVVLANGLFGAAALVFVPLIALVGAARLRLGRHTLAQVLVGAALGGVLTAAMFAWGTGAIS